MKQLKKIIPLVIQKQFNMSTFKERLIDEQIQLNDKIEKLSSFILSDNFKKVDSIQQTLLNIQLSSMKTYSQCLKERLDWLDK